MKGKKGFGGKTRERLTEKKKEGCITKLYCRGREGMSKMTLVRISMGSRGTVCLRLKATIKGEGKPRGKNY